MTWFQRKGSNQKHQLIVDQTTNETICIYHGTQCINKKNKFHANKQEYNGILYDSQKEANRAAELSLLERAGDIHDVRRQVRLSFSICERCKRLCLDVCRFHKTSRRFLITAYFCDFSYRTKDNVLVYEEIKGNPTSKLPAWKIKRNLLEALLQGDESKRLEVIN